MLFNTVVEAFLASREYDAGTLSRLAWWLEQFGSKELTAITPEDVDAALVRFAERGKLRAGRAPTISTGRPLSAGVINRYVGQLASIVPLGVRGRDIDLKAVTITVKRSRRATVPPP